MQPNIAEQDHQQALAQNRRAAKPVQCITYLSRPTCQPLEPPAGSGAAGARPGFNNRDGRTHAMLWNACAGWGEASQQQHTQVLHKIEPSLLQPHRTAPVTSVQYQHHS